MSERFISFKEAKEFMKTQNVKSIKEYRKWAKTKRPPFIPSSVERVYKDSGWNGYPDFCCYEISMGKIFLPFKEARAFIHTLNLRSTKELIEWLRSKANTNIPLGPNKTYKNKGWKGYRDFCGYSLEWLNLDSYKENS